MVCQWQRPVCKTRCGHVASCRGPLLWHIWKTGNQQIVSTPLIMSLPGLTISLAPHCPQVKSNLLITACSTPLSGSALPASLATYNSLYKYLMLSLWTVDCSRNMCLVASILLLILFPSVQSLFRLQCQSSLWMAHLPPLGCLCFFVCFLNFHLLSIPCVPLLLDISDIFLLFTLFKKHQKYQYNYPLLSTYHL